MATELILRYRLWKSLSSRLLPMSRSLDHKLRKGNMTLWHQTEGSFCRRYGNPLFGQAGTSRCTCGQCGSLKPPHPFPRHGIPPPPPGSRPGPPLPPPPGMGQLVHVSKKKDSPGRRPMPLIIPVNKSELGVNWSRGLPHLKRKKRRWWPWKPNDTRSLSSGDD
jgi:hypothetical protein